MPSEKDKHLVNIDLCEWTDKQTYSSQYFAE